MGTTLGAGGATTTGARTGDAPAGPDTAAGTDTAAGVSAAATSSARWRRLLEAGRLLETGGRETNGCELEGVLHARTITFVVGASADGCRFGGARAAGLAVAEHGSGVVVELEDTASPASQARISAALAEARTGWRFRVIGDEPALGALRALLHEAGVLDEEIALVVASPGPGAEPGAGAGQRLVYCGHCQSKTLATDATTVACSGCGLALTVYYHFSRRQGAYLGYFADAEFAATPQPARDHSQLALA